MIKPKKNRKEMKKRFAKLSKAEQEKVELKYHHMTSDEFDHIMLPATPYNPDARLRQKAKSASKPSVKSGLRRSNGSKENL